MDVEKLLEQYNIEIVQIFQKIPLGLDIGTPIDELFVLRFLLSTNGNVDESIDRIKKCIEWRSKNLSILQFKSVDDIPNAKTFLKYSQVGFSGHIDNNPVFIVRVGYCNLHMIMKELTVDQVRDFLLVTEEHCFQAVDKLTRQTGVIHKMVNIIDMRDITMDNVNLSFIRGLAKASSMSSYIYPQLVCYKAFVGVPRALRGMWNMFNSFFNTSAVKKHILCAGNMTHPLNLENCYFFKDKSYELPTFLGGSLEGLKLTINQ